jgi:FHS family L-fucose permease-like MFS transporter
MASHAQQTRDLQAATAVVNAPDLRIFVFGLFFIFGGITSLNDVLIPKMKELFTLSYAEVMLIQSVFFAAYLTISIPAAGVVKRIGYMSAAALGLTMMMVGCLLFVPASASGVFAMFLVALFVLASGITVVQVVANPLISMLGPAQTAHSRLTFAQAFNSLGTTVFPYFGSILILGTLATVDPATLEGAALAAYRTAETQTIVYAYLGLAAALGCIAIVVWMRRKRLVEAPSAQTSVLKSFDLLKQPRFAFGTLCIFVYVGAEVAIGSVIVNYLMQTHILGFDQRTAGEHVALYWGGAMVGRFIGAYVLRLVSPGMVLATVAAGAIALLILAAFGAGALAGYGLLAVGLCNSIMFPTIFSLASEGLGARAADGSGIICVAIVGGAVVPPLTGYAADLWSLQFALLVPVVCYVVIAAFGVFARKPA